MNIFLRFLMTLLLILIVGALFAAGWHWYESRHDHELFTASPGRVCANLKAQGVGTYLREHPETQVLDVRSLKEFKGGSLPGAINLSIGDAAFDTKVAALDKEAPVLVYCASGLRSRQAVGRMKQLGFRNIRHLHRGYLSWKPEPHL